MCKRVSVEREGERGREREREGERVVWWWLEWEWFGEVYSVSAGISLIGVGGLSLRPHSVSLVGFTHRCPQTLFYCILSNGNTCVCVYVCLCLYMRVCGQFM